jgi:pimeloyl-ACP methyl ester carboxylesterase
VPDQEIADHEVTSRFRGIPFDMPWHGKSSPDGWWEGPYQLTTVTCVAMIKAVSAKMALDRPVVLGCSLAAVLCSIWRRAMQMPSGR